MDDRQRTPPSDKDNSPPSLSQNLMGMQLGRRGPPTNLYSGFPMMDPYMLGLMPQQATGSFMNFMQSASMPQNFMQSSQGSDVHARHLSQMETSGGSSGSKRTLSHDDVSSPSKRARESLAGKKKKATARSSRCTPNKVWLQHHDDYLIPLLADLARKGGKCHKSMKRPAFTEATKMMNSKFKLDMTTDNIANHYRSLKIRCKEIQRLKNDLSGAGWNEDLQMIELDDEIYKTWAEANPRLKDYVNNPMPWFEDLKTIAGDDDATGSFRKSVYSQFGSMSNEDGPNNPVSDGNATDNELPDSDPNPSPIPSRGNTPNASRNESREPTIRRRSKGVIEVDGLNNIVDNIAQVAEAIKQARPKHWTVELGEFVYAHTEISDIILDKAYHYLSEHEFEGRLFIGKPLVSQKRQLLTLISSGKISDDEEGF